MQTKVTVKRTQDENMFWLFWMERLEFEGADKNRSKRPQHVTIQTILLVSIKDKCWQRPKGSLRILVCLEMIYWYGFPWLKYIAWKIYSGFARLRYESPIQSEVNICTGCHITFTPPCSTLRTDDITKYFILNCSPSKTEFTSPFLTVPSTQSVEKICRKLKAIVFRSIKSLWKLVSESAIL